MNLTLTELLLIGMLIDIVITVGWYALHKKMIILSMINSFVLTVISYTVGRRIYFGHDFNQELLFFALGGLIGTGIVVSYKKFQTKINEKFINKIKNKLNKFKKLKKILKWLSI